MNSELLEASEASIELYSSGTCGSSYCFDIGLVNRTGICPDFLVACRILYMFLSQLVWAGLSGVNLLYRGSHGRGTKDALRSQRRLVLQFCMGMETPLRRNTLHRVAEIKEKMKWHSEPFRKIMPQRV